MLIFERLKRQNNMKFGASPLCLGTRKVGGGWGGWGGGAVLSMLRTWQHEVPDALEFLPSQERSWRNPRDQISMLKWISKRNGNTKPSY